MQNISLSAQKFLLQQPGTRSCNLHLETHCDCFGVQSDTEIKSLVKIYICCLESMWSLDPVNARNSAWKVLHLSRHCVKLCYGIFITRSSKVIMFSPCVFVCLCVCLCWSQCLSRWFNYEGLVPHKQYFAGTLLGMSSCASYVLCTHDVIDNKFWNWYIPVNIWGRALIKSSRCQKC